LKRLKESRHGISHLYIEGDSELVINQMNGTYMVESSGFRPLFNEAEDLLLHCLQSKVFKSYSFEHISCSRNERADKLARDAIKYQDDWSEDRYVD
jgi:ribonuclease HI